MTPARRPIPADFEKIALHRSVTALVQHYRTSYGAVTRWFQEAGLEPPPRPTSSPQPIPVPHDFAAIATTLRNADLIERYGVSETIISRWRALTGCPAPRTAARLNGLPDPVGPQRNPNPNPMRRPRPASFMIRKVTPVPANDESTAGAAAQFLRRLNFLPVCRRKVIDKRAASDEWQVGRKVMRETEMVALAVRKGFQVAEVVA